MPYLDWITDENLVLETNKVIRVALNSLYASEAQFNRNVIDPFSAIFQLSGFGLTHSEWKAQEKIRQSEKTLQNHIGDFHQNLLGHVEGWTNLGVGNEIDLECTSRRIIAEVKNKYNTVSGGKLADVYSHLNDLVSPRVSAYHGYTAFFVQIIPKGGQGFDRPFTPSNRSQGRKCALNEGIREIDGASFYSLVTGRDNALFELYSALPIVLEREIDIVLNATDRVDLMSYFNRAFNFTI